MSRAWGVDTVTGLSRTFEIISLTSANLTLLESRVSDLDEYEEDLPVDELQHLRETAARLRMIREELNLVFAQIGESIHLADVIGNEETDETQEDGQTVVWCMSTFNRTHLCKFLSTVLKILATAEAIAVTLYRQFHALILARYPAYERDHAAPPPYASYGQGHLLYLQDLDDTEDHMEASEMIQRLSHWCGEDCSNIRHLFLFVKELTSSLTTKARNAVSSAPQ